MYEGMHERGLRNHSPRFAVKQEEEEEGFNVYQGHTHTHGMRIRFKVTHSVCLSVRHSQSL